MGPLNLNFVYLYFVVSKLSQPPIKRSNNFELLGCILVQGRVQEGAGGHAPPSQIENNGWFGGPWSIEKWQKEKIKKKESKKERILT